MGGQPGISGGGGGWQRGGVCAIPSPKRCSPRRLGLANSYSAVAGWACGIERPDMAADAVAALGQRSSPNRRSATPPAAQRAQALSEVGAGSTPPKIVRSLGRRGGGPECVLGGCDQRRRTPSPLPRTPFSCRRGPERTAGVQAWRELGGELGPEGSRGLAETLPNGLHVSTPPFLLSSQAPCTLLHKALQDLMFCKLWD